MHLLEITDRLGEQGGAAVPRNRQPEPGDGKRRFRLLQSDAHQRDLPPALVALERTHIAAFHQRLDPTVGLLEEIDGLLQGIEPALCPQHRRETAGDSGGDFETLCFIVPAGDISFGACEAGIAAHPAPDWGSSSPAARAPRSP